MSERKLKIFQMNERDWWADYDLAAALKNYADWAEEVCGTQSHEIKIDAARELTEEEMRRCKFRYHDSEEMMTFAEELNYRMTMGEDNPQFFASTEY